LAHRVRYSVGLLVLAAAALAASGLFAQGNLASALDGARIAKASSTLDKDSRADNLLDGNPATTWATAKGKLKGQYVIIELAVRRAMDIGAVVIDNSVAAGHPGEAALRNVRIAVSSTGTLDEDFAQVKLASCVMGGGRQVFTFSPAKAEYVKLTLDGNYGAPDWIELADVQVYAAGVPPVERTGVPSVLFLSDAADPSGTGFAAVAQSLAGLGASVATFPGPGASRSLSPRALPGFRVVVVSGDRAPTNDDIGILTRHCEKGGGLVCAVPPETESVAALLEALGVSASSTAGAGDTVRLAPHWITDGLASPALPEGAAPLTMPDSTPLATVGEGQVVAVAGERGSGRIVLMPTAFLRGDGSRDALELSRRAILWAAAMEDVGELQAPPPVQLSGTALFVGDGSAEPSLTFGEFHKALGERGLAVSDLAGDLTGFGRPAIGEAKLLIALMPSFGELVALDTAGWVQGGGALMVLGDADADVLRLIGVNEFLRDYGMAMTLSPSRNLSVGIRQHPATAGITALSRPGEPLGVWCLQGVPLAEMGGTPVAMARTFGQGRVIAMDAGFACDQVMPAADRKKPAPPYGIQLEQNRDFVLRCVAWLLGAD
jgi:hypothetical protein